jgi:anaerobic magnesium-protoporphyrin IX monomethyl ester cyclase
LYVLPIPDRHTTVKYECEKLNHKGRRFINMVVLTHAYFLCDDPKEQVIMKPYPPLGLLCLAAWLDQHGLENTVFDSTFSTFSEQKQYLLAQKPAIVAIYANLMTKIRLIELMQFIRREPTLRHTCIVLGGPDVTHNADNYLQSGADVIIIGEGEQTLQEVAQAVLAAPRQSMQERTPALMMIPGLAFRLADGALHRTVAREKLRQIDELPVPARHKIDLPRYLNAWKNAHGHSAVSISTQRGCPYTCRWCSTAVYGQSYRRRSPQQVAAEIALLQQQYDFDLIWFVDDVFTVSHKWLAEFYAVLQAQNLSIQFECITRADRLTDEVIRLLRACGCFRVWIGAESGSQRILDAMDRRVDAGQVRDMIVAARRAGMQAGTFIMLGYPGETEADIRATVEHLKAANPDLFTITVAYPIKGTGLYETVETTTTAPSAWHAHTDRDLDFVRTYPRRYYDYAVRWTVNAVHWHKTRLSGRAWTPHAWRFWLKMMVARGGMVWEKRRGFSRGFF